MSRRPGTAERPPRRVSWFEGAALRHADLRDAIAHEARLLALHVSAMHGTWGAALGLTVVINANRRELIVTPGLAYTCRGESLVLTGALRLDPPRANVTTPAGASIAFDLVASVAPAPEGWPCERLVACDGAARVTGAIALRWEMAGIVTPLANDPPLATTIRVGDEVPLARVIARADGTLDGPDYARRRIARGIGRPHIASGVVAGDALAWRDERYRLVATVDTSDRGFTMAPRYFVSSQVTSWWGDTVIGPFVSVIASRVDSFDVALSIAMRAFHPLAPAVLHAVPASVSLAWTGVETARGCPSVLRGARIATLAGGFIDAKPWLDRLAQLGVTEP